jgi:cytochrome c biogenesis protein CcmG/thiol:disulfide interchange protein DsbE
MSKLKALLPLIVFLALGIAFAIGLSRDPRILPSTLIDRPIPAFSLTNLYDEGVTYSEADLRGQVSLINVFGSWCAPCAQEHPILSQIARNGKVRLIGVNWRDNRENAIAWLGRNEDPYSLIIFDDMSLLAIDLGVTGAPESFITDAKGNIRYKYVGIITPQIWHNTLLPIITTLKAQAQEEASL